MSIVHCQLSIQQSLPFLPHSHHQIIQHRGEAEPDDIRYLRKCGGFVRFVEFQCHSDDQSQQHQQPEQRKSVGAQIEEQQRPAKIHRQLNDHKVQPPPLMVSLGLQTDPGGTDAHKGIEDSPDDGKNHPRRGDGRGLSGLIGGNPVPAEIALGAAHLAQYKASAVCIEEVIDLRDLVCRIPDENATLHRTAIVGVALAERATAVSLEGDYCASHGAPCTYNLAATTDGTGLKATCTVTVIQLVTSVVLNYTTLTIGKGSVFALDATVLPENADNKAVTWSSSNTSAVMDLGNGEFYAKAAGTSTITATAADGSGKKATCTVTVLSVMPTAISMSEPSVTIKPTETTQLSATITPSTASDVTLVWESSNPEVATVSNTGLVTATEAEGVTTITATIAGASTLVASAKVYVTLHDFVDLGLPSGTLSGRGLSAGYCGNLGIREKL